MFNKDTRIYREFVKIYGEPSFPKFVDMILERGRGKSCAVQPCLSLDVHWKSYLDGCSYCDLKYDYISKVSLV